MKARPIILAVLSLPAAALGYAVSVAILSGLSLPPGLADPLILFVPLLIAALCMVPFVIPAIDSMAKRDLEAYRARTAADGDVASREEQSPDA